MSPLFEELAHSSTRLGELSLRRRRILSLDTEVVEIKLGGEYLMSSLFTASEIALAELGLREITDTGADTDPHLDIVVGGLGLGYTARDVLANNRVRSLIVVEALETVIEWHESGLIPLGVELTADPRCRLETGDFFTRAASTDGFDPAQPGRRFDAVLVDIDHSPDMLLHEDNSSFYTPDGLRRVANHLRPGGVFGLWSNDRPDDAFTTRLSTVFTGCRAEPVTFHNPLQDTDYTQTVYIARRDD